MVADVEHRGPSHVGDLRIGSVPDQFVAEGCIGDEIFGGDPGSTKASSGGQSFSKRIASVFRPRIHGNLQSSRHRKNASLETQ
jgi:hypothetical protein